MKFLSALLLCLCLRPFPAAAQAAAATQPTAQATIALDYDAVYPLQLEYRRALAALAARQPDAFAACAPRCTVTALREAAGWAKFVLFPTELIEDDWQHVETYAPRRVEIVAEAISAWDWNALPLAEAEARLPPDWIDATLPPLDEAYHLPWAVGLSWWATYGWHDGNAIDFQPALVAQRRAAGYSVHTANSGLLRELCWDGYQSLLQVEHDDGRATYYLHVTLPPGARRERVDHPVAAGAYLGNLIRFAPFNTACGRGGVRHLHFISSDRALVLDGNALETIAATASCCASPPLYTVPGT